MSRAAPPPRALVADPTFPALKARVIQQTGLAYFADKDEDLAARVRQRLTHLGLRDCASYLQILEQPVAGAAERDALAGELTIGETHFFRYEEQFQGLRERILPELLENARDRRTLRIWSAGCATGPEPYSLAILLQQSLGDRLAGWDVRILATDLNREFLARAEAALYGEWALRGLAPELRAACFTPEESLWRLRPEYRQAVRFRHHNLVEGPYPPDPGDPAPLDLILCRNVMIYFAAELARKVVARFRECLREGGWLLVGHAEPNPGLFIGWEAVHIPGATLYRRPVAGELAPPVWSAPLAAPASAPPAPAASRVAPEPALGPASAPPPLPDRYLAGARALADRGEWRAAEIACRSWLARHSLDAGAYYLLALILEHGGRDAEAERALRQALFLERDFVLARYQLALSILRRGDGRAAGRELENVLAALRGLEPGTPLPHGEGLTAGELRAAAETYRERLAGHAA